MAEKEIKEVKNNIYTPPAKMVALAAKTSEVEVHKVRAGKRKNGKAAKRVLKADEMLVLGISSLVEEVKRVVNF